jgi:hypothetical protein
MMPSLTKTTTPTIRPSSTWTEMPTLSSDKANALVMDLLQHNAGCQLPCWWGITPGSASWSTVSQFLGKFAEEIWKGNKSYVVTYNIPDRVQKGEIGFFYNKDTIHMIFIAPEGTDISYQLHQLLATYGEPDEVWLQGWPYNDEHVPHFALLIVYHEGILARYEGIATSTDIKTRICTQESGPELTLWDPAREDEDKFIQDLMSRQNDLWGAPKFQLIQDVTDLDVKTFYEIMQNPDACVDTQTSLWDNRDFGITATPTPGK